ncbi:hypothetical protein BW727_200012 (plasmid) [Jeotgalibaca dankookensis]|uniref:Uncharacterized protein n=1 Tax=Jeotgalibaca dankookensis TaxID=708126 RepID=A0A1S6IS86_9LACT|nr:plasmid mobilization relaxosome protein MobC [Jeotgalibaca dankookensis]AQS54415.1 hypothetical protein BW727_200012 [Jeotgalibaca dankookensis]
MVTKLNRQLKRDNRLFFDLSDDELAQFQDRFALYRSTNRSQFIRELVLNNYIIVNDDTHLRALVYEVNKIGTNINQLARLAQQSKHVNEGDIDALKKDMAVIKKELFQTLLNHNRQR